MHANFLTDDERLDLLAKHRAEKDRRTADRIKAVLLADDGMTYRAIAKVLFWDEETISRHVHEYIVSKKLTLDSGGSEGYLSREQIEEVSSHLESHTYATAKEVSAHIREKYHVDFSEHGMANWLRAHGFSYGRIAQIPGKYNPEAQKVFAEEYRELVRTTSDDEPIFFMDAVHPTMATKTGYGWFKTGAPRLISGTAVKHRLNIIGAINLSTMQLIVDEYKTVNHISMERFLTLVRQRNCGAKRVHIIADNVSYNSCSKTLETAEKLGIVLHFLPPYSPNLNPIERLWKVMNKHVRNNKLFTRILDFRENIMDFFWITWDRIAEDSRQWVNDNFHFFGNSAV